MTQPFEDLSQLASEQKDHIETWLTEEGYKVPLGCLPAEHQMAHINMQGCQTPEAMGTRVPDRVICAVEIGRELDQVYRALQGSYARDMPFPIQINASDTDEIVRIITECMMPLEVGLRFTVTQEVSGSNRLHWGSLEQKSHYLFFANLLAEALLRSFFHRGMFFITHTDAVTFPYFYHSFAGSTLYLMNNACAFSPVETFGSLPRLAPT